jgi:multiple sugar transport system ATP-binding protein
MARVSLENITHIYDQRVTAVDDLSMECEDGKLTALLGPSGCGKTTLLRIIVGLLHPTSGKVYYDEEDVTDVPPEKREVSMVFQFPVVYTTMSIYDNLAIPLRARKLPQNEIKQRVKEMADFLGLTPHLDLNAGKLTADLKQATSLGRAIIRDSRVLLLDEPLTNIDPKARIELRDKIIRYKTEMKQTIIYVTHDQGEALTLGDKIAVMKDGELLQYDTLENVYERPKSSFIASFLGNPGMNLIDCSYRRTDSKRVLESGGFRLELPHEIAETVENQDLEEVILGIRPEHIELSRNKMREGLPAKCEIVEDYGNLRILILDFAGERIRAKSPITGITAGEEIYVQLPRDKIRIFNKKGKLVS